MFNQALDEYPDHLKPFERIDKIMTAKKDWTNQQRNYRKMIKRLGQEVELRRRRRMQLALWHGLGEIYRSRLKMYREAAEAFEVCVRLEPDNLGRHQILAELYQVQGPECYDKAIREYRLLIARAKEPKDMVPALKILRRLYAELGKYDQVWCVASTLSYLEAGRRRGAALLRAVPQQGPGAREVAPDRGELAEAPLPPARGPLHLAGAGQHQPDRHRDSRARAPRIRHQAQGSSRPGHRPADAEPGVRVRRPSARREHAGAVPAPGLGRRHGASSALARSSSFVPRSSSAADSCRAGRRRSWPMRSASD